MEANGGHLAREIVLAQHVVRIIIFPNVDYENYFLAQWTSWISTSCTKTCGGGIKRFSRTCENDGVGGQRCPGNAIKSEACNDEICCMIFGFVI